MRYVALILAIFTTGGCAKPHIVQIMSDHGCVVDSYERIGDNEKVVRRDVNFSS